MTSIDVIASALGDDQPELGAMSSPDGALTLLFCDIEDAAAIIRELGEERAAELLRDHRAIVERVVAHHGGTVAKAIDDGFMVAFDSAHAALRCALDLQSSLAGRTVPGGDRQLALRVGLHTGFVIMGEEEFYGRNVVLGARVANCARGGEITVSSAVKEYTETDPSFQFEERGEHRFKGVLGEHMVYAVVS
ncbi:MAG TPA: adenylate/guanylate cyclase domain-containing protein [Solirubrobacteraceae bacterium]|nr:adenylate/guanylate cyclase domain-containing protein [Solirubrobacteraceae bacterium]